MAEPYDLVVVGGGTNGPALMLTALLSGLKRVALIEKGTAGRGIRSRAANAASTGMVQPGLKYLISDLSVVMTDALDCRLLRYVAGDLLTERPFMLPVFADYRSPYHLAQLWDLYLSAYDPFSSLALHAGHRFLKPEKAREQEPGLRGPLVGAVQFDEWVTDPVQLARAMLAKAQSLGGIVMEHCEVTGFELQGLVDGTSVRAAVVHDLAEDTEFLVPVRYVINAAGAWASGIGRMLGLDIRMRPTLGTSIEVYGRICREPMVLFDRNRRYVTLMPHESTTVIGPTNVDVSDEVRGDPDLAKPSDEEIKHLLDVANRYLDASLTRDDIAGVRWGLRPQLNHRNVNPYDISHRFAIYDHRRDGVLNACTLIGGKLSSQLRMARETVALACGRIGHPFTWDVARMSLTGDAPPVFINPRRYRKRCGLRLRCDHRQDTMPGRASRRQRIRAVMYLAAKAVSYLCGSGRRKT